MTSTHRDLPVPDASVRALALCAAHHDGHLATRPCVLTIASPVVAAVLSDIADQMDADGMAEAAGWLRVRAGEYGGAG